MNPFRRIAFQVLRYLAWTKRWWRHYDGMNVIVNATDLKSRHLVSARNTTDVCPDAIFNFRCNPWLAILGTESEMVVKRGVGVAMGASSVSRRYATRMWVNSCSRP